MLAGKRPAIFRHQVGNFNSDRCDLRAVGIGGDFHQRPNVQTPHTGVRVVGRRGSMPRDNSLEIPHKIKQFDWINSGVLHESQGLSIPGNIVQQRLAGLAQFPRRSNRGGREIALHRGARNHRRQQIK